MKFTFHGAAGEVGRSCILIDDKYMLDAGLKITEHGNEYPTFFDPTQIEVAFISHAHLDHTGALPILCHDGLNCPVVATRVTKETTKILLQDSLHIELITHAHPGYAKKHIFSILDHFLLLGYNKPRRVGECMVQLLPAGHIPGSASILLQYGGKKILYTGDINYSDTQLLKGANYIIPKLDIMITESTYGDRNHPSRVQTEEEFIRIIREVLDEGGSVLVPAFAVGRAQELMLLLAQANLPCPIYLDGMARKVTDLYSSNPSCVKDISLLRRTQKRVTPITSRNQRKSILREQCIILTTSGMVTGGPVMEYYKLLYTNPQNALLLTGYQGEGTNGRVLLQEKSAYIAGKKLRWSGRLEQFDFSAHAGQNELIAAINRQNPKHLIINHGDPIAIQTLASKVKKAGRKIYQPSCDGIVEIN